MLFPAPGSIVAEVETADRANELFMLLRGVDTIADDAITHVLLQLILSTNHKPEFTRGPCERADPGYCDSCTIFNYNSIN